MKQIESISAYPLQWPLGHPRSSTYRASQFKVTMAAARDSLLKSLQLWKAKNVIISSNAPLRKDGLPYATFPAPPDQGVAVYFLLEEELRVIPCDEYKTIAENMRAIQHVVEALRTIERHGGLQVFKTAFTGFKALPERGSNKNWWEVLGVSSTANAFQIDIAFKKLAKLAHPDRPGGNAALMAELTEAREQGLGQLGR